MSRVLVLGGTGSIGRLVVSRLRELDESPLVLSRDPGRASKVVGAEVHVVRGDLTDARSVREALVDVDMVVMTHGAPYGSGSYEAIDYGAVPTLLEALDGREVRVALMSSIGVTGTGGSSREILDWKRRGERLLRASGLPYTIVRPGWFDAGASNERHADFRQGDETEYGHVRREDVAEALVQALRTPVALSRTVEVFSVAGPPREDWDAAYAATYPDAPGSPDGAHDRPGLPLGNEPLTVQADLRRWATIR
ncbi:epimerase [Nocardioides sp. Root1257]|uniref:SDR family oxidoreductase n=1 Tax=unclassified Nocardioides TaxID=2615069 RepID=UPI0006FA1B9B|nr:MULTISPECIES: SDR family oxidoreductase [unclassified Nocardioides]KQW45920.1 epimerase [Nocardioides sp. Root1257]KRC43184.1 epimerase [Nocardioides sp. Root224]